MPVFNFPTGTIVPHASTVPPTNWVSCDGSAYDGTNATYSNLWSVIGTTYGGTGQSSFCVPSLGSRVPVGPKSTASVTLTNPSFATNTTGVTAASGSTVTRDTTTYDSSPASLRWDKSGTSNALDFGSAMQMSLSGTFTAGVSYTLSWKMRASSSTQWLEVGFGVVSNGSGWAINGPSFSRLNYDNYAYINGFSGVSTSGWTSVSISWTPTTTVSSGINLAFVDRTSFFGTAGYFWFDSMAVTSTVGDGGLGTWYGATDHLLTSTQTGIKYHNHTVTNPGHNHGNNAAGGYSSHGHTIYVTSASYDNKNTNYSINAFLGSSYGGTAQAYTGLNNAATGTSNVGSITVGPNTAADASAAHTNIQPEIALNYIIKL